MPRILLIITGSVAAYKALDLIAELKKHKYEVEVILTKSAQNFISKIQIEEIIDRAVHDNLWADDEAIKMQHINLTRICDYILVYPLTADFLNKVAAGFADNLALATILASDKKIFFVPAMNVKMYENLVTQESIKKLTKNGHVFIGPDHGALACGEVGLGRVVEWQKVLDKISLYERFKARVKGKKVLITAGGTVEAIDPVRFISNYSSGIQGYEIAKVFHELGAKVAFVHGRMDVEINCRFDQVIEAKSAATMYDVVMQNSKQVDIAILAAAVADYRPENYQQSKMKKQVGEDRIVITLVKNPDILAELCKSSVKPKIVIGFAAESENLLDNARLKLERKNCDYILANDISNGKIFGKDSTKITLVSKNDYQDWPEMPKSNVAYKIIEEIL